MVADGEEIELPDAVRGAVIGVAAECNRLGGERADPMCNADLQGTFDTRVALDRQLVGRRALADQLARSAPGHDLGSP